MNIEDLFINLQVFTVYSSVHSISMHCRQKLWEEIGFYMLFKKNRVMDFMIFDKFKCTKVSLVLGLRHHQDY